MLFQSIEYLTATIASGQSLSASVSLGEKTLVGIVMPAGWDAADLTFQASADGSTFGELNTSDQAAADAVAAVQVHSPAAGQFIGLDPARLKGVAIVKLRSGTSGTPVNQTATRALTLVVRGLF